MFTIANHPEVYIIIHLTSLVYLYLVQGGKYA